MKPVFFWEAWKKPYKYVYKTLLFIFLLSVIFYVFTYFAGSSFVIHWEIDNIIKPVHTLFDSYRLGVLEFPIYVNNYVIFQSFIASDLQVNLWPAYLLLVWLGIFISIILALISDLSRFWFVASVILITVLFVGLKLDYLVLFNSYQKIGLVVVFILYFPTLYVFHFIRPGIGFITRLFVHLCATALFGLIIFNFSHVSLPFLHLVNYGIYVPLILTILFAFMVGHEIVSSLLRVINSRALVGDKGGLVHFFVISLVFILNAVLVLLLNSKILDLDMYVIGSFWLLTIASILGIWGYRAKEITYRGMFSFNPIGGLMFICLAITAHLTISYFFITGNDSFVEAIEDVIIYSQLGYSAMFLMYVIVNFYELLKHNIDVGKVLYKPQKMPYFISRFAGVIVIMALFFRFNMTPYYQAVAGYYSGVGDLYLQAEDYLSASEYYNLSSIFSGTSHRANYALATMEKRNGNDAKELNYLQKAVGKNPTEFAFANLASKYLENKRYFQASFALQDGLEIFPNSGYLMNNLGLVYKEIGNVDSAFYYLEWAIHDGNSVDESATNIYGLIRENNLSIKSDTLDHLLNKTNYLASINNLVVLCNQLNRKSDDNGAILFNDPREEKMEQLVYNYNKTLNISGHIDSSYLEELRVFYDSSNTSWFQDNLNLASALALFRQGQVSGSFHALNQLAVQNPEKEYYSLLGKLSLKLKTNGLAIDYFKHSFQNGHLEIAPELAYSYMENGDLDKAAFVWRQIEQFGDSIHMSTAQKMIRIIEAKEIVDILFADENTRYYFLAYRYREFDLEKLEAMVLSFDNEDIQAMALLHLINANIDLNQKLKAYTLLEKIGQLDISMDEVLNGINLAQCRFAYHFKDAEIMQRLQENLKSDDITVSSYLELFRNLNDIQAADISGRMESLGYRNPIFEPGVLESVNFFNNQIEDPDKGYDLLLQAVNLNPFSIELNKAYALQCLKVGLRSYALDTKEELKTMMSSVMFKTFEDEFLDTMTEFDANDAIWQ